VRAMAQDVARPDRVGDTDRTMPTASPSTTVMWFRRDLRLADLPALHAAVADGSRVVPLFVVDPAFDGAGVPRRASLADALQSLDESMGGALVCRHGNPTTVVPALAAEVGASAVHVSRDYAPYGRRRDAAVSAALRADERRLVGTGSPYAVDPGSVTKADGSPYAVFTPFSKAWRALGWDAPLEAPDVDWLGAPSIPGDGRPVRPQTDVMIDPPVGEGAAHARWEELLPSVDRYRDVRNLPAVDGTTRLSAALRWGVLHPRQLLADLDPGSALATELAWREFYADVLFHRPETAWRNLNERMNAMAVDTGVGAEVAFERWAAGTTGFPIIDAGMRQLLATGWMHNRVRMLVGSFLVKDLHLPWQWGARHFMQHLIDGDLASNSHGWQWVAGTGTDAAPYFRIFNPTTQAARFDPDGEYVRRWVPELATDRYPAPMVDHAVEREEALRRYREVTAGSR
jgi:deoxyribodipyrimidine photo-lyase